MNYVLLIINIIVLLANFGLWYSVYIAYKEYPGIYRVRGATVALGIISTGLSIFGIAAALFKILG